MARLFVAGVISGIVGCAAAPFGEAPGVASSDAGPDTRDDAPDDSWATDGSTSQGDAFDAGSDAVILDATSDAPIDALVDGGDGGVAACAAVFFPLPGKLSQS